jgi:hypothetical protein
MNSNIINTADNKKSTEKIQLNSQKLKCIADCKEQFSRSLLNHFSDMFASADDALFKIAEKADSDHVQNHYFDAMRDIRKQRTLIEKRYLAIYSKAFDIFWKTAELPFKHEIVTDENMAEQFSLVDKDELEEKLAIDNMISKGRNLYREEVNELNQRVSAILGGLPVNEKSNPFAPYMLCQVYFEVTIRLPFDLQIKLVIASLFDQAVLSMLAETYQTLNAMLAKSTVLSDSAATSPSEIIKQPTKPPTEKQVSEVAHQIQTELFQGLQELLAIQRGNLGQKPVMQKPEKLYKNDEVLGALTHMQQNTHPGNIDSETMHDVRAILLNEVKKLQTDNNRNSLGQTESDTLDVVSMLFEFILEDSNLPATMKVLIGKLQIPIIKVAMLDKSFFSKKTHPARRLLNELAHAGVGWDNSKSENSSKLFSRITLIVDKINEEFTDNIQLFQDLLDQFLEEKKQESRFYNAAEQRTKKITQGKERLSIARLRCAKEILNRIKPWSIPDNVKTILDSHWFDVLILRFLKQGVESEGWHQALKIIDDLVWSLQPKPTVADRKTMLKMLPILMEGIKKA